MRVDGEAVLGFKEGGLLGYRLGTTVGHLLGFLDGTLLGARLGLKEGALLGYRLGTALGYLLGIRVGVEGATDGFIEGLAVTGLQLGAPDERLGLAVGRPSQARVCSYTAASKGWSSEVAQE